MSISVRLIGRSHFIESAFLSFLRNEAATWKRTQRATEAEEIIEAAGRICYMSFGKQQSPRSNREYVANLIQQGHESVLEHVSWTFLVTGISRALSHQLVRHRVGFAFSQLSQQYHEEGHAKFVLPSMVCSSSASRKVWKAAVMSSKRAYREILKSLERQKNTLGLNKREWRRAVRTTARGILPNATETKLVMTANARALRHFLRVRGAITGDEEMRLLSAEILMKLRREAPSLFYDFDIKKLPDGSPIVVPLQTNSSESSARPRTRRRP
jgi:thymidylate synthase (FAD)